MWMSDARCSNAYCHSQSTMWTTWLVVGVEVAAACRARPAARSCARARARPSRSPAPSSSSARGCRTRPGSAGCPAGWRTRASTSSFRICSSSSAHSRTNGSAVATVSVVAVDRDRQDAEALGVGVRHRLRDRRRGRSSADRCAGTARRACRRATRPATRASAAACGGFADFHFCSAMSSSGCSTARAASAASFSASAAATRPSATISFRMSSSRRRRSGRRADGRRGRRRGGRIGRPSSSTRAADAPQRRADAAPTRGAPSAGLPRRQARTPSPFRSAAAARRRLQHAAVTRRAGRYVLRRRSLARSLARRRSRRAGGESTRTCCARAADLAYQQRGRDAAQREPDRCQDLVRRLRPAARIAPSLVDRRAGALRGRATDPGDHRRDEPAELVSWSCRAATIVMSSALFERRQVLAPASSPRCSRTRIAHAARRRTTRAEARGATGGERRCERARTRTARLLASTDILVQDRARATRHDQPTERQADALALELPGAAARRSALAVTTRGARSPAAGEQRARRGCSRCTRCRSTVSPTIEAQAPAATPALRAGAARDAAATREPHSVQQPASTAATAGGDSAPSRPARPRRLRHLEHLAQVGDVRRVVVHRLRRLVADLRHRLAVAARHLDHDLQRLVARGRW